MHQKLSKKVWCIFLYQYLALKIQPCTISPILKCVSCITINTSMLTSLVRIHAVHHTYIWTVNFVNNSFWKYFYVLGWDVRIFPFINAFNVLPRRLISDEFIFCVELCSSSFFIGVNWLVLI